MNIVIRVDASEDIGTGHVMRCIALGQLFAEKGISAHFISLPHNRPFMERIVVEGFKLHFLSDEIERGTIRDADETIALAKTLGACWVITDGYAFLTEYQARIKQSGLKSMCIDDVAGRHYVSDIILNQNFGIRKDIYSAETYTRIFLGPQYTLIRREFVDAAQKFKREIRSNASRIVITMGGADPNNASLKVLQAIASLERKDLSVKVILGSLNKHYKEIVAFAHHVPFKVKILRDVREELPLIMQWADVAITSGGSILWEYALFSTPLMAIILAENQVLGVQALEQAGALYNLGWFNESSVEAWGQCINDILRNWDLRKSISEAVGACVRDRKINEIIDVLQKDNAKDLQKNFEGVKRA